jgi:hypothetical protein
MRLTFYLDDQGIIQAEEDHLSSLIRWKTCFEGLDDFLCWEAEAPELFPNYLIRWYRKTNGPEAVEIYYLCNERNDGLLINQWRDDNGNTFHWLKDANKHLKAYLDKDLVSYLWTDEINSTHRRGVRRELFEDSSSDDLGDTSSTDCP